MHRLRVLPRAHDKSRSSGPPAKASAPLSPHASLLDYSGLRTLASNMMMPGGDLRAAGLRTIAIRVAPGLSREPNRMSRRGRTARKAGRAFRARTHPPPSPAAMRRSSANAPQRAAAAQRRWRGARRCEERVIRSGSGLANGSHGGNPEALAATRPTEACTLKPIVQNPESALRGLSFMSRSEAPGRPLSATPFPLSSPQTGAAHSVRASPLPV